MFYDTKVSWYMWQEVMCQNKTSSFHQSLLIAARLPSWHTDVVQSVQQKAGSFMSDVRAGDWDSLQGRDMRRWQLKCLCRPCKCCRQHAAGGAARGSDAVQCCAGNEGLMPRSSGGSSLLAEPSAQERCSLIGRSWQSLLHKVSLTSCLLCGKTHRYQQMNNAGR